MKKLLAFFLCPLLVVSLSMPTFAAGQTEVIYSEETVLEDGTVVKDEVIVTSNTRATEKTATRRKTFTQNDETIAIIAFTATFRYDGSSVFVISKSVTQTDTYQGWSYTQTAFTSTAGSVNLKGKLTKLVAAHSFTLALHCDKNGNLST